jgi:hypothetical protein
VGVLVGGGDVAVGGGVVGDDAVHPTRATSAMTVKIRGSLSLNSAS